MDSDTLVTRFDQTSRLSTLDAVLDAVSEFTHTDAEELRCLNRYIDGDAIGMLFGDSGSSTTHIEEGTLTFRYDDVFVTVTHDGWIEVVDTDEFRAPPTHRGLSADARAQRSTEVALDVAATALAEAEEHIWTAASSTSNDDLVDPLWAVVERLWALQTSLDDMAPQSPPTETPATRPNERR